jgi:3-hydroxybutyrate dehydrogenase
MKNKVVFVTGSSSGIGLSIARSYAQAGANLILHGIEADFGLAQELEKEYKIKAVYMQSDLSRRDDTIATLRKATQFIGDVDILVNNAGIQFVSPIEDFPFEKWQSIIDINLSSVFYLSQFVWAPMKKKGFGRIINISSVHGLRASEFKSAYVAAKHAVCGLTKVLALEGANTGITANAICPGYVHTPLVDKQIQAQAKAHGLSEADVIEKVLLKKQPIKKFVSLEAISQLSLYLSQPYCETVTGASFVLDGGWTSQ